MTQETRETLTAMRDYAAAYIESAAEDYEFLLAEWPADIIAQQVRRVARQGRRALALRDVLTPRTCGTCRHWHRGGRRGVFPFSCDIRRGEWRRDDGCLKGWQAREGEGGEG